MHGYITAAATAGARAVGTCLNHTGTENYRVNRFNHRNGKVVAALAAYGSGTEAVNTRIGAEYVYCPLSAVEYNGFLHSNNSGKALGLARRIAGTDARLKLKADKEANGHAVKATGELYRLYRNGRGADLRRLCADLTCMFNYALTKLVKPYAYILKAVTVAAGVKHLVGVDNHTASAGTRAGGTENAVSVIRHIKFHPFKMYRIFDMVTRRIIRDNTQSTKQNAISSLSYYADKVISVNRHKYILNIGALQHNVISNGDKKYCFHKKLDILSV